MVRFNSEEIPNFEPKFICVGTILLVDSQIFILERALHKPQGGKWCTPGGKVNPGETHRHAALRELHEEAGFKVWEDCLKELNTYFVRYEDYDFVYKTYMLELPDFPPVHINKGEHIGLAWVMPSQVLKFDLIQYEDEVIKHTFNL